MLTNELIKYDPHIVALQEIRWIGKGIMQKREWDLYHSCHETELIFGTGFLVKKKIKHFVIDFHAVSMMLCSIRIKGKFVNINIICAHAPTEDKSEDEKDDFYDALERIYERCP
jgi:exonuclease III